MSGLADALTVLVDLPEYGLKPSELQRATSEIGHTVALTVEQRGLFPVAARLEEWRRHCQTEHRATQDDYRLDVVGWHKTTYPECSFAVTGKGEQ